MNRAPQVNLPPGPRLPPRTDPRAMGISGGSDGYLSCPLLRREGVYRRVSRRQAGGRLVGRRRLPEDPSPGVECASMRPVPVLIAHSDGSVDLPVMAHHAHRRTVDIDLARGNGEALRVHRPPVGDARDPQRDDHGGRKDCFHRNPLPPYFPFDAAAAGGDSAWSTCRMVYGAR